MNTKTGKQGIIEQFLADGIHYMFGNPGTVEQGFLDALEDYPDFKYIMTLQESIAVAVGDAYARKNKRPAVVQLHSGVGLGNGIGMMYQAMRGHSPIVVISGTSGIKYDAMEAQMSADLVAMAKPVTKWAVKVSSPSSLLRILRRAIKVAGTPPMGPVFVELPMDVLDAPLEEEVVPSTYLHTAAVPEDKYLREIADTLASASNPMIIMGDGISFSDAQSELEEVSALAGAEVWGADSSEVNMNASLPQFKGLLGHMFGETSRAITMKADAVLICGTYVFPEVFPELYNTFKPGCKVMHIDLDSYEIAKNFPVDIGLVGDPKVSLNRLAHILKDTMSEGQMQLASSRMNKMQEEKQETLQKQKSADWSLKGSYPLKPAEFMEALSKHIPSDAIIFDEALTTSPELNRYIPAQVPGQYFQTRGGSLGVGIPGAMGLKLSAPDKTVISFSGDGGSLYTIQALWTAAHYNIGAKFIICNNHSYKLLKLNIMQYWKERDIPEHNFPRSFEIANPQIGYVEMARAMGVDAVRVERAEEIEPAIIKMLNTEGPFLIDLVIDSEVAGHKEVCKCGQ